MYWKHVNIEVIHQESRGVFRLRSIKVCKLSHAVRQVVTMRTMKKENANSDVCIELEMYAACSSFEVNGLDERCPMIPHQDSENEAALARPMLGAKVPLCP